jgi:hypothetical protein
MKDKVHTSILSMTGSIIQKKQYLEGNAIVVAIFFYFRNEAVYEPVFKYC